MALLSFHCPYCNSKHCKTHTTYKILSGEERNIYHCQDCGKYFSQTKNTALEGLKTPISTIAQVLEAINEGMGINAACRTFNTTKKSIKRWQKRLGSLKEVFLLYALCHQFLQLIIEGDELYTKVGENKPPSESSGWTIVLMDRASRFIWELSCGEKETELFENAMATLLQVIKQTDDLSLVTDGEHRYGNLLFDICQEVIRTGKKGRPKTTLEEGVKVRIKNFSHKLIKQDQNVQNIKHPNQNTLTLHLTLKRKISMLIIWKHLIVLYGFDARLIVEKLILMQKVEYFYRTDWMFIGFYTIL